MWTESLICRYNHPTARLQTIRLRYYFGIFHRYTDKAVPPCVGIHPCTRINVYKTKIAKRPARPAPAKLAVFMSAAPVDSAMAADPVADEAAAEIREAGDVG
jgi:hypothetical protein